MGDEEIRAMKSRYSKFMGLGLGMLLLAFALLIFRPFGVYSVWIALLVFALAVIPLEIARRTARVITITMLRDGNRGRGPRGRTEKLNYNRRDKNWR